MKLYRETQNVGRARYVISYHNGQKTHNDGSPFYDIATFRNKPTRNAFIKDLKLQGYTPQ